MSRSSGEPSGIARQEQTSQQHELTRLKQELVAAQERGEQHALARLATQHPALAGELIDFAAAFTATESYEREVPTAATRAVAERARARAWAAVFPDPTMAPAAAGSALVERAVASLKVLRRARGLTLVQVAQQLGLGADVLSALEAGLVRAASVPERFVQALAVVLQTSAEQTRAALGAQPLARPALQRTRPSVTPSTEQEFADAVAHSPAMSAAQKARWVRSE
jgi:transcriptional regulator with XRE-family HTH domain